MAGGTRALHHLDLWVDDVDRAEGEWGVNHLALTVETRDDLDRVRTEAAGHGWQEMYADRYPHAGGEQHVALYVESSEGFEVEVVVGD